MFDLETALRRMAGDHELVQMLIRAFLDNAPTFLNQIRASIPAAQWQQAHHAAHSLRGLAANIDAKGVVDAAGEIEGMTAEVPLNFELLQATLARLEQALATTMDALKLTHQP